MIKSRRGNIDGNFNISRACLLYRAVLFRCPRTGGISKKALSRFRGQHAPTPGGPVSLLELPTGISTGGFQEDHPLALLEPKGVDYFDPPQYGKGFEKPH